MTETSEGTLLWEPPAELKENAVITRYVGWLKESKDLSFDDYNELWEWSVNDVEGFWSSLWEFLEVKASNAYERVLAGREMPGSEWFPWAELREKTAALSAALQAMGVGRGDRVVAYMPNVAEAVVAFLACASIGAVWSSGSPDFGAGS